MGFFVQDNGQPPTFGGVGHAVAAYLQTKGMVDQATILKDFAVELETLAALFWLFAVAMALGTMSVLGDYRRGIYLLIGPALFFFMIADTAETNGTELRFWQSRSQNLSEKPDEVAQIYQGNRWR